MGCSFFQCLSTFIFIFYGMKQIPEGWMLPGASIAPPIPTISIFFPSSREGWVEGERGGSAPRPPSYAMAVPRGARRPHASERQHPLGGSRREASRFSVRAGALCRTSPAP